MDCIVFIVPNNVLTMTNTMNIYCDKELQTAQKNLDVISFMELN